MQTELNLLKIVEKPEWKTVLIDLVRRNKMNIWAIDVAKLAREYLRYVKSLEATNLKVPANVMLACSILLKMKAAQLKLPKEERDETHEEILSIAELPELKPVLRVKEATVTLDELIKAIDVVMESTKRKAMKKEIERKAIAQMLVAKANMEKLTENINELYERIVKLSYKHELLRFSELLAGKDHKEIIKSFICLLFLHSQKKIIAWQDTFFGEIYIMLRR